MTFHFKWHEGDAGFKWFAECLGEHPHGTNLKGRIEIVDRAVAGMVPAIRNPLRRLFGLDPI